MGVSTSTGGAQPLSSINNTSMRRNTTSEPHETPHTAPVSEKEWCPFHVRPRDRKWTWWLHFLARQQFTVLRLKSTRLRGGREGKVWPKHHIWRQFNLAELTAIQPDESISHGDNTINSNIPDTSPRTHGSDHTANNFKQTTEQQQWNHNTSEPKLKVTSGLNILRSNIRSQYQRGNYIGTGRVGDLSILQDNNKMRYIGFS